MKRGTWFDTVAMVGALLGVSMPAFWFGIMLMLVFGLYLGWLPTVVGVGFGSHGALSAQFRRGEGMIGHRGDVGSRFYGSNIRAELDFAPDITPRVGRPAAVRIVTFDTTLHTTS